LPRLLPASSSFAVGGAETGGVFFGRSSVVTVPRAVVTLRSSVAFRLTFAASLSPASSALASASVQTSNASGAYLSVTKLPVHLCERVTDQGRWGLAELTQLAERAHLAWTEPRRR